MGQQSEREGEGGGDERERRMTNRDRQGLANGPTVRERERLY